MQDSDEAPLGESSRSTSFLKPNAIPLVGAVTLILASVPLYFASTNRSVAFLAYSLAGLGGPLLVLLFRHLMRRTRRSAPGRFIPSPGLNRAAVFIAFSGWAIAVLHAIHLATEKRLA